MPATPPDDAVPRPAPPAPRPAPPAPRADEGNGADAALDDSLVDGVEAPPDGIEQEVLLDLADGD